MNERIKHLAEQAKEHANHLDSIGVDASMEDIFNQKFAELIVRECMNIARKVGNKTEPDDWALDRCYEIEQRIQDRFGVEE